jgi:phosphatidylglycerophosphate synthase
MDSSKMITYNTIRRDYQAHCSVEVIIVDHYAKIVSPVFTRYFVAAGISPNAVTVLMMIFGVIGAFLFAIPHMLFKACGLILIHLWYVMDCSDGEVARITKRFSQFGTELDYTAHLVCHPLFCIAFACSLISMARYDSQIVLFVSMACISSELVLRNIMLFFYIYDLKMGSATMTKGKHGRIKTIAIHVTNALSIYPNYALIFPIAYFIDYCYGTSIALYYLFVQTTIASLMAARMCVKWIRTVVGI